MARRWPARTATGHAEATTTAPARLVLCSVAMPKRKRVMPVRPPRAEAAGSLVNFRASPAERAQIEARAAAAGLRLSDYLRRVALAGLHGGA